MAIYRQIQTTYWQDKFILTLTPEEKFFYIYLLTNSKTKQCGIYELPIKIIEVETGYNRETVIKLLQRFIEHSKIQYDWEFEEIAIKNWIKHNNYDKNEKIAKCVEKELKEVRNETFIGFMGFEDTLCIGYHNKNKNKNKNKKNNKNNSDDYFLELFNSYSIKSLTQDIWIDWCNHRKEIKHKLTPLTAKMQLESLSKEPSANEIIKKSIQNGWQGLFPIKEEKTKSGGMVVHKDKSQYTKDEWNILINETCKTAYERKEVYEKYSFDNLTNLWIRK